VDEATAYAREEVAKSCQEIQEIMDSEGLDSVESVAALPEVSQRIRMVLRRGDGAIQMVAIMGPDHAVIYRYDNNQALSEEELDPNVAVEGSLAGSLSDYSFKLEPIRAPTSIAAQPATEQKTDYPAVAGYVGFQMADDVAASHRVQRLSTAVTESLGWMVVLLLSVLAAALVLLYKVFNRHLALEKEKEAQSRMAAIGTLAAGLAHEIRNPLQVINMNLDVVREDLEEAARPADQENHARTARVLGGLQGQITHLNQILHDFMQFAMPGRMEKEELSLPTLIGDTLEFMTPELERSGVETEVRISESARIQGDPSALRRVLLNVILNAVRAMDGAENRRLLITAEPGRGGSWQIRIDDTGCGIPEGKEEEIFDAFVSFRPGGTGFGLAIARRIIEEHGGHIRAERRPGGAGASIRISLPGLDAETQPAPRPRRSEPASDPV